MPTRAQNGIPADDIVAGDDGRMRPSWVQWLEGLYRRASNPPDVAGLITDLAAVTADLATATADLATQTAKLTALEASVAGVGSFVYYAYGAAPLHYLYADGSVISRTTYSALFAVLGTTYGAGDGSTTFSLPDLSATTVGFYYIRFEA